MECVRIVNSSVFSSIAERLCFEHKLLLSRKAEYRNHFADSRDYRRIAGIMIVAVEVFDLQRDCKILRTIHSTNSSVRKVGLHPL